MGRRGKNVIIQGQGEDKAHISLESMRQSFLSEFGEDATVVAMVHDEVVVEVPIKKILDSIGSSTEDDLPRSGLSSDAMRNADGSDAVTLAFQSSTCRCEICNLKPSIMLHPTRTQTLSCGCIVHLLVCRDCHQVP